MSLIDYNEKEYDYDYYGDTRNNPKFNEETNHTKHSYNYKINKKINYAKQKKEKQREIYEETKQKNEAEKRENEEQRENNALHKKERKRNIKIVNEENKNFGNNFEKIENKVKKTKKPKKDRIRFQKTKQKTIRI